MKNISAYLEVINSFSGKRILVIGDLMLDVYLKGTSTRLCPEAPVPIVDVYDRTVMLGGAANVACNLKALGAEVHFCTLIGCDREGQEALALLEARGISHRHILRNASRRTITKSRVLSGSQVITRIDQGSEDLIDDLTARSLVQRIQELYAACDGIVISDYDKGVITESLIDELAVLHQSDDKLIAVDSKRLPAFSRLHAMVAKPNYDETLKLLSLPRQIAGRAEQLAPFSELLFKKVNATLMAVTLDSEGSMLIENGKVIGTLPAPSVANPFVAGAGDSYLSAFVLSALHSRDTRLCGEVATAAAAVALGKECTATCRQAELKSYFNLHNKYIDSPEDLRMMCDGYHQDGKRIIFTNGCFDILHSGHVTYLHRARQLGDVLVVGMNTDESIRRIKGRNRPINAMADRLQVLAGLSSVDLIVPFGAESDDTPVPLIRIVRPHIFAKGGDYTKDRLPEAETVQACGGEIVFLDHIPDHSTTLIINRIARTKAFDEVTSDMRS